MRAVFASIMILAFAPLYCAAQESVSAQSKQQLVIEDIQCRGNASTSCGSILGYLYLAAGDRVDETEIQNAKLRLTTLPDFKKVDIYLERGSARGSALLIVEVVEADPIFREFSLGTSARLSSVSQNAAVRIGHQNMFGRGKIVDLTLGGQQPFSGPVHRGASAQLRYADPHLFDSKKYFAFGGVAYVNARDENRYGSFGEIELLHLGVTVGRRLWDFSYLTVGYGYNVSTHVRSGRWQSDGTFETKENANRHGVDVIYGWNSEDDFYFPTRGSAFRTGFGWAFGEPGEFNAFHLQFRKTWQTRNAALWTIKIGGDPTTERRQSFNESQYLSLSFARPIAGRDGLADIKRGRWYVEPGVSPVGFDPFGRQIWEAGLKAGVRLEIESLGLVDLYVIGSTQWTTGGESR